MGKGYKMDERDIKKLVDDIDKVHRISANIQVLQAKIREEDLFIDKLAAEAMELDKEQESQEIISRKKKEANKERKTRAEEWLDMKIH